MAANNSNNANNGGDQPISPTVSREKWASHARAKLSRGYVLIIGKEKQMARFFKPGRGYEVCPAKIARRLMAEGIIEESGEHHLGTIYRLAAHAALAPPPPPPRDDDDDDEDDGLDVPASDVEDLLDTIVNASEDDDEEEDEDEENRKDYDTDGYDDGYDDEDDEED